MLLQGQYATARTIIHHLFICFQAMHQNPVNLYKAQNTAALMSSEIHYKKSSTRQKGWESRVYNNALANYDLICEYRLKAIVSLIQTHMHHDYNIVLSQCVRKETR